MKSSYSELVSTMRSTALILRPQEGFPAYTVSYAEFVHTECKLKGSLST